MTTIHTPIEDTQTLISRPVVLSVTKSLLQHLNISPQTRLYYNGAEDTALQPGSTLNTNLNAQAGINTWASDSSVTIEIVEKESVDRINSQTDHRLNPPIFCDPNINLNISPSYVTMDCQVRLIYKAPSRSTAQSWRDLLIQKYRDGFDVSYHTASYTYLIPNIIFAYIYHAYTLMQTQAPYEDLDFQKWFYSHCSKKVGPVSNQGNTKSVIGVSEQQVGIMVSIEESILESKSDKLQDTNAYTTELVFRFNFDRVSTLRMEYPLIIHNSVVDDIFIPKDNNKSHELYFKEGSYNLQGLTQFEYGYMNNLEGAAKGISIPQWDDWQAQYVLPDTACVFTSLCTISNEDRRTLIDLNDLDVYRLRSEILDWIKDTEYTYITGGYTSAIIVSLYEDNTLMEPDSFFCTKPGLIISKNDLDLRKTYHVRFALHTNIFSINKSAHDRLVKSGMALEFLAFMKHQTKGFQSGPERILPTYTDPSFNMGNRRDVDTGEKITLDDYWSGKYPLQQIRNWYAFHAQTFFTVAHDIKHFNPEINQQLNYIKGQI